MQHKQLWIWYKSIQSVWYAMRCYCYPCTCSYFIIIIALLLLSQPSLKLANHVISASFCPAQHHVEQDKKITTYICFLPCPHSKVSIGNLRVNRVTAVIIASIWVCQCSAANILVLYNVHSLVTIPRFTLVLSLISYDWLSCILNLSFIIY